MSEVFKLKSELTQEMRLDLFLAANLDQFSRSFIKNQINQGKVLINGEVQYRPHYKVKPADQIIFSPEAKPDTQNIIPQDIPLNIIYEDADLIVIDKPAGLVVHPATGNWEGTLMNALYYHYKDLESVGSKIRSGLIHRLDKDTSGIVLIGKTNKGLWHYSKQFANRNVEKTYLAVVNGNFLEVYPNGTTEVSNYLGRSENNRKKFSKVPPSKGKSAKTIFEFVQLYMVAGKQYSLLRAIPITGRTHQIRVHLSQLGFPIVGDTVYSRGKDFSRLMLHAYKLKIPMLSGEQATFESKPEDIFYKFDDVSTYSKYSK